MSSLRRAGDEVWRRLAMLIVGEPVSMFSYDTRSQRLTQALENHGLDFKYASAGPGAIVIEQFGAIHLYDLKSGKAHKVEIQVAGDLPELRPHYLHVASRIQDTDISPTGQRAVFEARGEILTVPAEKGDIRNLTNTQQELSHLRSVFLYSLEKGESRRVTDGMSDSFSPVFDKSGKYLYFLASTDAGPTEAG